MQCDVHETCNQCILPIFPGFFSFRNDTSKNQQQRLQVSRMVFSLLHYTLSLPKSWLLAPLDRPKNEHKCPKCQELARQSRCKRRGVPGHCTRQARVPLFRERVPTRRAFPDSMQYSPQGKTADCSSTQCVCIYIYFFFLLVLTGCTEPVNALQLRRRSQKQRIAPDLATTPDLPPVFIRFTKGTMKPNHKSCSSERHIHFELRAIKFIQVIAVRAIV